MKKSNIAICALLAITCAAPAHAFVDFYVGMTAGVGGAVADNHSYSSNSYGAMLGIDIPLIRVEAEYNYFHGSKSGRGLHAHTGMLNGYLKAPIPIVSPYIGGGVGQIFSGEFANADMNSTTAYQAMLGLQVHVPATPLYIDVETRALYANNIAPGASLAQWDGRLKLRYQF